MLFLQLSAFRTFSFTSMAGCSGGAFMPLTRRWRMTSPGSCRVAQTATSLHDAARLLAFPLVIPSTPDALSLWCAALRIARTRKRISRVGRRLLVMHGHRRLLVVQGHRLLKTLGRIPGRWLSWLRFDPGVLAPSRNLRPRVIADGTGWTVSQQEIALERLSEARRG